MLADVVVNFMKQKCRKTYNLENAILKEKTVADNKVKFKFEKMGDLKLQVEFGNEDIANIIYNNFLNETETENITAGEFKARLNDYLELNDIETEEKLNSLVYEIIEDVNSEKLFRPGREA